MKNPPTLTNGLQLRILIQIRRCCFHWFARKMLEHQPGFFLILLCTIPNVGIYVKPYKTQQRRDMSQHHQLPSQGNETRASNVALPVSQWCWIDQKHVDIQGTWGTAKKNVIIRAALTIAMESNPDLTGCTSEDDT
jgi:hypothetical protein